MLGSSLAEQKRTFDVDRIVVIPFGLVHIGEGKSQFTPEMSGVVDDDIDLPKSIKHLRHQSATGLIARYVGYHC